MKKLKLKKALLATSLALPITLTTSNGTAAMRTPMWTNNSQIGQNPNNSVLTKPNTPYDTYSYKLEQFLSEHKDTETLNEHQHIEFLRNYIRDDITKYLALLIQTNYRQLSACGIPPEVGLSIAQTHYVLLSTDPIEGLPEYQIITKRDINEQIPQCLNYIRDIINKTEGPITPEEQILSLLFSTKPNQSIIDKLDQMLSLLFSIKPNQSIRDKLDQMQELIQAYTGDENTPVDQFYSTLISFLDPVAHQLDLEDTYQDGLTEDTPLALLAQRIREFRKAYQTKLDKQKREKEEAGDIDIKGIEKLINDWIKQKEKTNKDKEEKLKKLEQAINSLEQKYDKIVKGNEGKRR